MAFWGGDAPPASSDTTILGLPVLVEGCIPDPIVCLRINARDPGQKHASRTEGVPRSEVRAPSKMVCPEAEGYAID